jgi:hypothetical protein
MLKRLLALPARETGCTRPKVYEANHGEYNPNSFLKAGMKKQKNMPEVCLSYKKRHKFTALSISLTHIINK